MFWRFGGYANISTLDSILDKPDVTVEELLDESDLIQELKQQNSKLVEFLRDEPVLKKLLDYVTAEEEPEATKEKKESEDASKTEEEGKSGGLPFFGRGNARSRSISLSKRNRSDEVETEHEKKEAQRKKYAYVACEVLSSEVWSITEAIMENREHLRQFWQYIHRPAPLDPLQAGYFTKVNEALLDKKTEEMLDFFKSLDGIVPAILQHVDCPMVMDLLLKIISLEKHEGGEGIVDWLQTQDLIPLLLDFLSPEHSSATQTSAGDFLKAIITISANATTQDQSVIGPNELTRQLVSDTCIKTLIDDMLRGGNPLTVGVGIIIEVIRKNNSDYDLDNQVGPDPKTCDPIFLGTLLRQFANHIPDFMRLVRSKGARKPDLKAAFGGSVEPLGFDRFKTCELMAELLHCSNMGLLNERGAEEEVRKRDLEREQLKAEGKLATPRAPPSPSHDEFGSSVDSHGFHHAERPDTDELHEAPEEIKKLEVQNASDEDGFEKVTPPTDDLPEEVTFDEFNEKIDETGLPALEKSDKRQPESSSAGLSDVDVPRPLSPSKPKSPPKQQLHFDPPPTRAADSPTTAGVTERIGGLDMDEDTVMTEFGEDSLDNYDDDGPTELEKELAKAERPAPLFARKEAPASGDVDPVHGSKSPDEIEEVEQSVATLQGESSTLPNGERQPYDTEADGSPVVGDLLKIRFVEHHVVPTILDFFFRFSWNNFLHNVVYDVVQQVFNGTLDRGYNRTLALDLFHPIELKDGEDAETVGFVSIKDITDRVLDGQRASDESQKKRNMRLGYMGHLTLIAEEVCKFGNRLPTEHLDPIVFERVGREEWTKYVEGTLAETRDKDNAVLGGVRPENAMQRPMSGGTGLQSSFSSNTANALASAGIGSGVSAEDSLAMSEGTVGQSFEVNSGTMLSGFGDGDDDDDDDEDMEDHDAREQQRRGSGGSAFSEDEQDSSPTTTTTTTTTNDSPTTTNNNTKFTDSLTTSPTSTTNNPINTTSTNNSNNSAAPIPPPLSIPPSRARRQLAARLAQRKQAAEAASTNDPDAADASAVETAHGLPREPSELEGLEVVLKPAAEREAGLRVGGSFGGKGRMDGRISGMGGDGGFSSSGSEEEEGSNSSDEDVGNRIGMGSGGASGGGGKGKGYGQSSGGGGGGDGAGGKFNPARRPSTTEAKERKPLDDDDDDDDDDDTDDYYESAASGGLRGEGSSEEEEDGDDDEDDELMVEIKPRRTSLT